MAEDWVNPCYEQGLVSVIIPCHNQERFLPSRVESASNQAFVLVKAKVKWGDAQQRK
jgi:hypothetical protein